MTEHFTHLVRCCLQGLFLVTLCLTTVGSLSAETALHRGTDGVDGVLIELGQGVTLYADAHGTNGPVIRLPSAPSGGSITGPHGQRMPGLATPFGTPIPPSNLTPAPRLPYDPQGTVIPQPSRPPVPLWTPGQGPSTPGSGSSHH